jgi:ArsR family transcriptional regulator
MAKQSGLELERVLRALSDRTRLRLFSLLTDQEVCVCYLVEALNLSQPKVSRHLAYLRKARMVAARREGKWMHYRTVSLQNPNLARLVREIQESLSEDKQMKQDRARLTRACCAPHKFVRLQGAPLPASLPKNEMTAAGLA